MIRKMVVLGMLLLPITSNAGDIDCTGTITELQVDAPVCGSGNIAFKTTDTEHWVCTATTPAVATILTGSGKGFLYTLVFDDNQGQNTCDNLPDYTATRHILMWPDT